MPAVTDKARSRPRPAAPRPGRPFALALREKLGMPQRLFARLASVSERSLAKLEKGETPSDSMRRQLTEIARLQEALAKVMNAKAIGNWFLEPNPAFDGLKPLEAVERGEIGRIWAMIYELESGAAG